MQLSAEIRWFWPAAPPPGLERWFLGAHLHGFEAGGGTYDRVDEYVRVEEQAELGIKKRGGKEAHGVEIKGLVASTMGDLNAGPFFGAIELWAKWSCTALATDNYPKIIVAKRRWLRRFDTTSTTPREVELDTEEESKQGEPRLVRGCNVELTRVSVTGVRQDWWTFAFEAFGSINTIVPDLRVVATALSERTPPDFGDRQTASYPTWFGAYIISILKGRVET